MALSVLNQHDAAEASLGHPPNDDRLRKPEDEQSCFLGLRLRPVTNNTLRSVDYVRGPGNILVKRFCEQTSSETRTINNQIQRHTEISTRLTTSLEILLSPKR